MELGEYALASVHQTSMNLRISVRAHSCPLKIALDVNELLRISVHMAAEEMHLVSPAFSAAPIKLHCGR